MMWHAELACWGDGVPCIVIGGDRWAEVGPGYCQIWWR